MSCVLTFNKMKMMTEKKQNLMLFYQKVIALDRCRHKDLKLVSRSQFEFAAKTHWVPIACSEFMNVSRFYPIIFVKDGNKTDSITAIALLGLKLEQNDYVDANGKWMEKVYIPSFVRRYPFVLATYEKTNEISTICIDEAAPHFNLSKHGNGIALFDDKGENSPFLNQTIGFLQTFKGEMENTQEFTKKLVEYDLLSSCNAQIKNAEGEVFQIVDMLVIDEQKLRNLETFKLINLINTPYMAWIYAHMFSLANLNVLFELHRSRRVKSSVSIMPESAQIH